MTDLKDPLLALIEAARNQLHHFPSRLEAVQMLDRATEAVEDAGYPARRELELEAIMVLEKISRCWEEAKAAGWVFREEARVVLAKLRALDGEDR